MKRILFAAALLVGVFVSAYAQNPDPDSRDKSRYAVNNFENDDLYTAIQTYEPVSVAMPKGKKVKNIIFMIGDGMGLEQLSTAWIVNNRHLNIFGDRMGFVILDSRLQIRSLTQQDASSRAANCGISSRNHRLSYLP